MKIPQNVTSSSQQEKARREFRKLTMIDTDLTLTYIPLSGQVVLAKEAGLSYAAVALVTDYDCWRENEQSVRILCHT